MMLTMTRKKSAFCVLTLGKLKGVQAEVHVDGDRAPIVFKPRLPPYICCEKESRRGTTEAGTRSSEVFRLGCPHCSSPEAQWTSSNLYVFI